MKLTTKQIMLILMSVLLVLVVVMGAIVLNRVSGLFQMAAGPNADTPSNAAPSSSNSPGSSVPASSVTSDPPVTTVPHDCEFTIKGETRAPSCDTLGYTLYYCECGRSDLQDYKTPLGHKYGEYTLVAATCDTDGWTERTCSRCKNVERTEPTKAGHNFSNWESIATAAGTPTQEQRTCSNCKVTEIRSLDTTKTWVLRKSTLDPQGRFSHYRIVVDLADSDNDPTYDVYTDITGSTFGFDYSTAGLTISYKIGNSDKEHIAPATGTNVLTIYVSGKVTDTTPVEDSDPIDPSNPNTSTGASGTPSTPASSGPVTSTPASSGPVTSTPASSGPAASTPASEPDQNN